MKKIAMLILFCGLAVSGFSIVPGYYGARSLSLGYAGTAYNYDVNSIFTNPALLSSIDFTLAGYQYQNSYMDSKNFNNELSNVLKYDLSHFTALSAGDKSTLFAALKKLYQEETGMYGYSSNIPGVVSKGYGISVSMVNTSIVNPSSTNTADIFNKDIQSVTNADIASLKMSFLGLKYKQISVAYGLSVVKSVNLGVSVHYLTGKVTEFNESITGSLFNTNTSTKDYLEHGWSQADTKFSKIVADVGASVELGGYFTAGVVMKNFGGAKIKTPVRDIALHKRIIAGLAFKPNAGWGFYLDMDVKKADLLYNGKDMQPIALGIEKGFFSNKFFLRAGMQNDLSEKHFLGSQSNVLYGMGLGFNMKPVVIDFGIGLNNDGAIKNLAISGFISIK